MRDGQGPLLTRDELYGLVWARPITKVASDFHISDVGLAKICRRADVPIPPRGYWAKRHAGLPVEPSPLPKTVPGDDQVGLSWPDDDDIDDGDDIYDAIERTPQLAQEEPPLSAEPTFPDDARERLKAARAMVDGVKFRPSGPKTHPEVARMKAEDALRTTTPHGRYASGADGGQFASPLGRRRLRLVNAVFLALERCGATTKIVDQYASDFVATVEGVAVFFALESQWASGGGLTYEQASKMLAFKLKHRSGKGESRKIWNERKQPLEDQLADVVVGVLVAGEENRRTAFLAAHRAEEQDRESRRRSEERRRQREAELWLEKLEKDAASFRRAADIRSLVAAARTAVSPSRIVDQWCRRALKAADGIDPVCSGTVFDEPRELRWLYGSW